MRSLVFTAVSLIGLLAAKTAHACCSPTYTPGEYYVFRAWEEGSHGERMTSSRRNLLEWQQLYGGKPSLDDIREVVYGYSPAQLDAIRSGVVADSIRRNSFAALLLSDPEAADYLLLAKQCEYRRGCRTSDEWWYPTKDDLAFTDLHDVVQRALAYKGKRFKSRYILQAIRAAFTMYEYDLCLELWQNHIEPLPPSSIRTMCEDYIGGVWFSRGDYARAILHYAATTEDSSSFWWCASELGAKSDMERIELLYRYCPTSTEFARMVQRICRSAEQLANAHVFGVNDSEDWYSDYDKYLENRARYTALRDFALRAASDGRSDNPAMWQYTAAFLTLIDGDAALAGRYLDKAATLRGTPLIKENVRILRIMARAMTGSYDRRFDAAMLPELQWLDGRIAAGLTDGVKKEYLDYERSMYFGYSMYYYNDMMRKIALGVMAPRYLARGRSHEALLLAGMTSERMRTLTAYRARPIEDRWDRWNIDFYTEVFDLMDSLSVDAVVRYRNTALSGGHTPFERFCASRSYQSAEYLDEIAGTKYMREERFDRAVEYLARVRPAYDTTLNVFEYYTWDPFNDPFTGPRATADSIGYKLSYARRMLEMQRIARTTSDPQIAAEMNYRYALALLRATDDCWALMRYGLGQQVKCRNTPWKTAMQAHAGRMLDGVYNTSRDGELRARCLAAQLWRARSDGGYVYEYDQRQGRWRHRKDHKSFYARYARLLNESFAGTDTRRLLNRECDTFLSYIDGGDE